MKIKSYIACFATIFFTANFGLADECPADTSYHLDIRTQVPDGTGGMIDNPTYGDTIATGLCACIEFESTLSGNENSVTLTVLMTDNEPIRGVEIDIYINIWNTNTTATHMSVSSCKYNSYFFRLIKL